MNEDESGTQPRIDSNRAISITEAITSDPSSATPSGKMMLSKTRVIAANNPVDTNSARCAGHRAAHHNAREARISGRSANGANRGIQVTELASGTSNVLISSLKSRISTIAIARVRSVTLNQPRRSFVRATRVEAKAAAISQRSTARTLPSELSMLRYKRRPHSCHGDATDRAMQSAKAIARTMRNDVVRRELMDRTRAYLNLDRSPRAALTRTRSSPSQASNPHPLSPRIE